MPPLCRMPDSPPQDYCCPLPNGVVDPWFAHGLDGSAVVLLEQIKTIDKGRIRKYLGKMTQRQMAEISERLETSLGLYVSEAVEAP